MRNNCSWVRSQDGMNFLPAQFLVPIVIKDVVEIRLTGGEGMKRIAEPASR